MIKIGPLRKVFFYLSNLFPTFIASTIIYGIPSTSNSLSDNLISSLIIFMLILSAFGLCLWILYLRSLNGESHFADEKHVVESNEISSVVSNYILAYAVSVLSISVVGGVKGMELLITLILVFGIYAFGWNVMLFNPFLMLLGYRIYSMELEDNSTGYFIRKVNGGPIANIKGHNYSMLKIDNYLYYLYEEN